MKNFCSKFSCKKASDTEKHNKKIHNVTSHDYFHGHKCHIPVEKLSAYEIKCGGLRRILLDLTTVHKGDVRALTIFRSYSALCAEKYRQYKLYPLSVHPYSKLRFYLEIIFCISMFSGTLLKAIHYSEIGPRKNDYHTILTFLCDVMTIVNIIANFFTGYIGGKSEKYIVLDLKSIACRYAKTWLAIDVVASIGCISNEFYVKDVTTYVLLGATRLGRLPIFLIYVKNIFDVMKTTIYMKTGVEIFILMTFYILWNIYFQFALEYISEGSFSPQNPNNCSWISKANLWKEADHNTRLVLAFYRAVAMLRTNTNRNNAIDDYDDCVRNSTLVSWCIAKILVMHCVLKYVIASYGSVATRTRYYMMTKQVETYMIQRKIPPRIRKKILKFYAIRFQSNFFSESRMLDCLSGQLRKDILMHTGRQLVRNLPFLKQLPQRLLMQIVFKLHVVIFIAGDIIFKINTVSDCIYFIDKGTVAIYSESGKEICHLEDGEYFGALGLVTRTNVRTASVVAVTNCELFRLDKEDFESTIASYPTVYEDLKRLATLRMEQTLVLDEHHKTEQMMMMI